MLLFKKLITPFVLPPGVFILGLLCSALWFLLKKNWKAGLFNFSLGCVMWGLSVAPISDRILGALESEYPVPETVEGDVIILLGGGIYEKASDLTGVGAPSEEALVRVVTAARLQKRLGVPIIACGGQVFGDRAAEAPVLKRFLVDLGVPSGQVILEQNSRDTFENAKYARQIVERFDYKAPLLVTSGFHMKRSVLSFAKVGMAVTPVPAGLKTNDRQRYGWHMYLPGNFRNTAMALKEYLGIVFYRLFYPNAA
jgi:uncharacterized SAM-binding protein YcdF (DUF218 family)